MANTKLNKIFQAGVIGAGGGGFPTHVKLNAKAEKIIVNGAECEPLLRVDQQLMHKKAAKMVAGLEVAMEITGAKEALIALKAKYAEAIASLEELIKNKPIKLHILGDFYPAGDEHVTVHEATGNLIPQGAIPLKVGCVVINVETLINISNAMEDKPVTDTYLTITGEVPNPVTLKLPVGTRIIDALKLADVNVNNKSVIDGGPMMGKIITDLSTPITKTTKGLIVLDNEHPLIKKRTKKIDKIVLHSKAACIQCRYCTDLCPRYLLGHKLEPHKIMRALNYVKADEGVMKMALICSECGVCEQYACIADLSPRTVNATIKAKLSQMGIKPDAPPTEQKVSNLQEHRKIPVKRLIQRLGLGDYDKKAPLNEENYKIEEVKIMLKQHTGAPSTPVVKVGQEVTKGELIAKVEENSLGANIHASINGIVTKVDDHYIIITSKEKGCDN